MSAATTRITVEPGKRGGKPCIRGLRITVWDVLGWLGAGMTEEQILDEHPDLEKSDFQAVYQFAAEIGRVLGDGGWRHSPYPRTGTVRDPFASSLLRQTHRGDRLSRRPRCAGPEIDLIALDGSRTPHSRVRERTPLQARAVLPTLRQRGAPECRLSSPASY